MRKNILFKALALILASVSCMLIFAFSFAGIWLYQAGLYHDDVDALMLRIEGYRSENLACNLANRYASDTLCTLPASVLDWLESDYTDECISQRVCLTQESWFYTIQGYDNVILESTAPVDTTGLKSYTFVVSGKYLVPSDSSRGDVSLYIDGAYQYYAYQYSQDYTVTVYLTDNAVTAIYGVPVADIPALYQRRYTILPFGGICLVLFALCLLWLCVSAGHSKKHDRIRPGGLNRLPLDLYGVGAGLAVAALLQIAFDGVLDTLFSYPGNQPFTEKILYIIVATGIFLAVGLLIAGFVFALAGQLKTPEHFWLKNTLFYRISALIYKALRQAFRLGIRFLNMLPLTGQWLLGGIAVLLLPFLAIWMQSEFLLLLALLADAAIIVYCAYAYGKLLKGAKQMSQGDLQGKITGKYLFGTFRDFSDHLNQLSDVTVAAADARLRSERMKTELITNVSHDIKTPLTSIINYTDLLRSAQDEATREEYLGILENQGQQLKRLIEDLTDLSRASTGNIQTNIQPMDATEAVKQALGEFADKLQAADLRICAAIPEHPVRIAADGRLFWRVMSNLIGNVVKYAQPGTRVYVLVEEEPSCARVSVKNISREPLNIRADELMERFVRGDQSRNTEGSGLGLSIAASLMDVQKGRLDIRIDADLFTATLTFPYSSF